jgi:hypothetical protein
VLVPPAKAQPLLGYQIGGRVALGRYLPRAPTDPDLRD